MRKFIAAVVAMLAVAFVFAAEAPKSGGCPMMQQQSKPAQCPMKKDEACPMKKGAACPMMKSEQCSTKTAGSCSVKKDGSGAIAPSAVPVNKICPVMGGKVDPKMTTVYKGKTIGFCCGACPGEFKKDPEKYMKNLK